MTSGQCNLRHCYYLAVQLAGFAAGSHQVQCWSAPEGMFSTYATFATTSAVCFDSRVRDSAWVVVDGTARSNTITL
ncbi:MAG: hypothetical protein DLM58_09505 [Pseudonocardiales bacterium]|nr:MAG: hypothetical protein DLM58_09505 [Pseudonocardiales bacterium]